MLRGADGESGGLREQTFRPRTRFVYLAAFALFAWMLGDGAADQMGRYGNRNMLIAMLAVSLTLLAITLYLFVAAVKLTPNSIKSLTMCGWREIDFEDIAEVRITPLHGGPGTPRERARVIGKDGRTIAFDSFLGGYEDLMLLGRKRANLHVGLQP